MVGLVQTGLAVNPDKTNENLDIVFPDGEVLKSIVEASAKVDILNDGITSLESFMTMVEEFKANGGLEPQERQALFTGIDNIAREQDNPSKDMLLDHIQNGPDSPYFVTTLESLMLNTMSTFWTMLLNALLRAYDICKTWTIRIFDAARIYRGGINHQRKKLKYISGSATKATVENLSITDAVNVGTLNPLSTYQNLSSYMKSTISDNSVRYASVAEDIKKDLREMLKDVSDNNGAVTFKFDTIRDILAHYEHDNASLPLPGVMYVTIDDIGKDATGMDIHALRDRVEDYGFNITKDTKGVNDSAMNDLPTLGIGEMNSLLDVLEDICNMMSDYGRSWKVRDMVSKDLMEYCKKQRARTVMINPNDEASMLARDVSRLSFSLWSKVSSIEKDIIGNSIPTLKGAISYISGSIRCYPGGDEAEDKARAEGIKPNSFNITNFLSSAIPKLIFGNQ